MDTGLRRYDECRFAHVRSHRVTGEGLLVQNTGGKKMMKKATVTRRTILRSAALATAALVMPSIRSVRAAGNVAPNGKIVLAWHTNIASRWLDPQQHDGTASPDNFIFAL